MQLNLRFNCRKVSTPSTHPPGYKMQDAGFKATHLPRLRSQGPPAPPHARRVHDICFLNFDATLWCRRPACRGWVDPRSAEMSARNSR